MATTKVIQFCESEINILGIRDIKTGNLAKLSLDFFGIESQVDDAKFMELPETEQRRHRCEDAMLIAVYGKDSTEVINPFNFNIVAH